jgi:prophage tail gpP-like protein
MVDVVAETAKITETIELSIGGKVYSVWTQVNVTRSLDAISGAFNLTLSGKTETGGVNVEVKPGDRCKVSLGGTVVINGWVDAADVSIDLASHSVSIRGRDLTGDLADCSAIHKPGSWRNARIEAIASELTRPFGVKVTAKTSTGAALAKFALQQGETVQAALERLMRFRGLIMVASADGSLEITTPGTGAPVATLELGVNIKSIAASFDDSQRFSSYLIKGQAPGNDHKHGKTVSQIRGDATDAGVTRYRPMLIVAEEQGDGASLSTRAKFEAGVRAGKSKTATIEALGWRPAAGAPIWAPNTLVKVKAADVRLADETMLVTAVDYSKGEGGTTARLTVMPPGAWKQLAEGGK